MTGLDLGLVGVGAMSIGRAQDGDLWMFETESWSYLIERAVIGRRRKPWRVDAVADSHELWKEFGVLCFCYCTWVYDGIGEESESEPSVIMIDRGHERKREGSHDRRVTTARS